MKQLTLFDTKSKFDKNSNILISCSGGKSSMFLTLDFIKKNKHCNILTVFANTGDENEQTLIFLKNVQDMYNIKIFWIEAYIPKQKGLGPSPIIVDFETASRDGTPLLDQSEKYGHCAITAPHCTRDLKSLIIHKFAKSYFNGEKYTTLQGLRYDEQTRINWKKAKQKSWIYPLAESGINKNFIKKFWSEHKKNKGFTLELKEHEGNCNLCFKKSEKKLIRLIRERPCLVIFRMTLELISCTDKHDQYRGNRSIFDLFDIARGNTKEEHLNDFSTACNCLL